MSAWDPYIDVRGTMQYDEKNGQARATLRMDFSGSQPGGQVRLVGQYVKQRGMDFADLQPADSMSYVDYVYIDFTDNGFIGRSNVSVRGGGFYKMACNYN
jgi:hypothetical protein